MMISSGAAAQFERGNPKYVSGMSGTELVLEVLRKSGIPHDDANPRTEYSCSPADLRRGDGILAYEKVQTGNKLLTGLMAGSGVFHARIKPSAHLKAILQKCTR